MNAENMEKKNTTQETKDEVKSTPKAAVKSVSKVEKKSDSKSETKAAVKKEGQASAKADSKSAVKREKPGAVKVDNKAVKTATKEEAKAEQEPAVKIIPRLKDRYDKEIVPALMKEMNYTSIMQVPRLQKIVVNIGLGEATQNSQAPDLAQKDLTAIAGQHPVITRAKKSIAAFKLRQGMPIGVVVTLRANRMYDFLDKLVNVALPRSRDFQGVPADSFDGRGNYTLGIREQTMFPEIDYSKVDKVRGMEVSIVTSARTDEEGRRLLRLLGMPFVTSDKVKEEK